MTTEQASASVAPITGRDRGSEESFAPFGCPVVHGASGDGTGSRSARRGKGYFVPGLIALVVLVAAGGIANFGGLIHSSPQKLAGPDVATMVGQGIQTQHGLASPPPITCPASEPVRTGLRFTCTWQRAGGDRTVTVTETGRGQFRYAVEPD